jgi:hypothetical protein
MSGQSDEQNSVHSAVARRPRKPHQTFGRGAPTLRSGAACAAYRQEPNRIDRATRILRSDPLPIRERLIGRFHNSTRPDPSQAEAEYRFYALYDKVSHEDILAHAYAQCRSNKGAPGVDGQDFADIDAYGVQRWLGELALALRQEIYRPAPIKSLSQPSMSTCSLRKKPAPTSEGSVHSNEDREQHGQRENTWSPIHPGASRDHRAKRGDVMPWILRLIARTTLGLAVVLALVWCALALWYRLPVPEGLRGAIVLCA